VVARTAANGFDGLEINTEPGYPVIETLPSGFIFEGKVNMRTRGQ